MNYHNLLENQAPKWVKAVINLAVFMASLATVFCAVLFIFSNTDSLADSPLPPLTFHFLTAAALTLILDVILNRHNSIIAALLLLLTHIAFSFIFLSTLNPPAVYFLLSIIIGLVYAVCLFACFYYKCVIVSPKNTSFNTARSESELDFYHRLIEEANQAISSAEANSPSNDSNHSESKKNDFNIFE